MNDTRLWLPARRLFAPLACKQGEASCGYCGCPNSGAAHTPAGMGHCANCGKALYGGK